MMSGFQSLAAEAYVRGLRLVHRELPPVLCAKLFTAMRVVRQLLVTADTFNEQVHRADRVF